MKDVSGTNTLRPTGSDAASSHDQSELSSYIARSHLFQGVQLHRRTVAFSDANVAAVCDGCYPSVQEYSAVETDVIQVPSEAESKWVHLGFSRNAVHLCASWPSSAESHTGPSPASSTGPLSFVTARQMFTRVIIKTDFNDLDPDSRFVAAVSDALSGTSAELQVQAFRAALDKWGHVIATWVELGGALFGTATLPATEKEQQDAVQTVLQSKFGGHHMELSEENKALVNKIAPNMRTRIMGGKSNMISSAAQYEEWQKDIDSQGHWTVIHVDGAHRTIDLLKKGHPQLFTRAARTWEQICTSTLLGSPESALPIPVYRFSGRLIVSNHQPSIWTGMSGYVEEDIAELDTSTDFTMSCWVLCGPQSWDHNACFLSIESPEADRHLVHLGKASPALGGRVLAHVWSREYLTGRFGLTTASADEDSVKRTGVWFQMGLVKTGSALVLYVEGIEVDRKEIPATCGDFKAERPRVCIGRGAWSNQRCDQWDGAVADVRVYNTALSQIQVAAHANAMNRPALAVNPVDGGIYPPRF